MKAINIIGAFTVLACNLVVSFSHTLDLFRAGGFSGGLEIIATVGVETVFIMGALNIVVARLRGVSPGAPAVMGGLLGVVLVSWSNVAAGWEYGWPGVLLGLATPASLIVAEAILSREIVQRREAGRKWEESREDTTTHSPTPDGETDWEKVSGERETRDREAVATSPVHTSPATTRAGDKRENASAPPTQKKTGDRSPTPTDLGEPKREEEAGEENRETGDTDLSHLVAVAREIMEREGRCGRVRLQRETGASEWECRRALAALRKGA